MKAPEKTSDQPRPVSSRGPVFVDASGRRLRRVKLIGLGVLGLVAGYVMLVLAAFIGGTGVSAPFLPLPAAAGPHEKSPATPAPASAATQGPAVPLPGPAVPVVAQSPAAVPEAAPVAPPVDAAAVVPAAAAAPAPAPAATSAPAEPGKSGTAPGTAGTAPGADTLPPGQTTRPTAPAHQ